MRRLPLTGGGWLLLAALTIPIIYKGAKPLIKTVGKGFVKIGEKLMEDGDEQKQESTKDHVEEAVTTEFEEIKDEVSEPKDERSTNESS